jgi:hypothetical protein
MKLLSCYKLMFKLIGCCLAISITSCNLVYINVNLRGLTSDFKKMNRECGSLFVKLDTLQTENRADKIIISNGRELLHKIELNNRTLVYLWSPYCKSKFCLDLNILQQLCNSKQIELIVVAEYYDCHKMTQPYSLIHNIYAINTKYYKTNITNRYVKNFLKDIGVPKQVLDENGRYFLFEKTQFKQRKSDPNMLL